MSMTSDPYRPLPPAGPPPGAPSVPLPDDPARQATPATPATPAAATAPATPAAATAPATAATAATAAIPSSPAAPVAAVPAERYATGTGWPAPAASGARAGLPPRAPAGGDAYPTSGAAYPQAGGGWPAPPGDWPAPGGGWPVPPGAWQAPSGGWPAPGAGYPPHRPGGQTGQPARRSRLRRVAVASAVAAAVAVAGAGAALGVTEHRAAQTTAAANAGGTGSGGTGGGATSSGGTRGTSGGGTADASAIASAIDPALVDINTTLSLQQGSAAGTGIVLTSTGEVLTNNHVIDGATSITATDIGNGRTYQATVVGYDPTADIAVIQLAGASNLATAPMGDSSTVANGDSVVAIGNAQGRGGTPAVVTGTVTALDQSITASDENGGNAEQLSGLIQIAADIEPGDSGGPLVDAAGRVVGIDTAGSSSNSQYQSTDATTVGFAIPINTALALAGQITAGRASSTVHIGATALLGVEVASATQFSGAGGAEIAGVVSGSPAEAAGLAAGDVIVSLGGTTIGGSSDLSKALIAYHPGDRVSVGIIDQTGQSRTVTVRLGTGPAA